VIFAIDKTATIAILLGVNTKMAWSIIAAIAKQTSQF
jgi:hypothetical protein